MTLSGQVNNYANPVLGDGVFGVSGSSFTYDFGTLVEGSGSVFGNLTLANLVTGSADDLRVTFDLGSGPFSLTGFDAFGGLGAGDSRALAVAFDPLTLGTFERVVGLELFGTNASGFDGYIGSFDITFSAHVAPVPLPAGAWLLGSALLTLLTVRRSARPDHGHADGATRC